MLLLKLDIKKSQDTIKYIYMNKFWLINCDTVCDFLKLNARNEEGPSQWSDEVCYRTLPDRPAAPPRPTVKGRIHAQTFKMKWDPPSDRGGADITTYILEIDGGSGKCCLKVMMFALE
jgi:hypothetical protein